ncbi:MAG: hypothetical protein Q8P50_01475 [Bacillota bacterium]|nr:hypothetical protein [Bacillota bacterium]
MSGDLTPTGKELLRVFDAYDDSAKKIAAILTGYADAIEEVGDSKQGNIFGGVQPTELDILTAAVRQVDKEYGYKPLFGQKGCV